MRVRDWDTGWVAIGIWIAVIVVMIGLLQLGWIG